MKHRRISLFYVYSILYNIHYTVVYDIDEQWQMDLVHLPTTRRKVQQQLSLINKNETKRRNKRNYLVWLNLYEKD